MKRMDVRSEYRRYQDDQKRLRKVGSGPPPDPKVIEGLAADIRVETFRALSSSAGFTHLNLDVPVEVQEAFRSAIARQVRDVDFELPEPHFLVLEAGRLDGKVMVRVIIGPTEYHPEEAAVCQLRLPRCVGFTRLASAVRRCFHGRHPTQVEPLLDHLAAIVVSSVDPEWCPKAGLLEGARARLARLDAIRPAEFLVRRTAVNSCSPGGPASAESWGASFSTNPR